MGIRIGIGAGLMIFKKLEVETNANEINYLLFILKLDNLLSVLIVSTSSRTTRFDMQKPLLSVLVLPMTIRTRIYS